MEKLEGQQCFALYIPTNKNYRIEGVAGSGKTLMAIYRFVFLYLENPDKNIKLLTYNNRINLEIRRKVVEVCKFLLKEGNKNQSNKLRSLIKSIVLSLDGFRIKDELSKKIVKDIKSTNQDVLSDSELCSKIRASVETVYSFCQNEINLNYKKLFGKRYDEKGFERVINNYKQQHDLPDRSIQFFIDEIKWLLEMNIDDVQYYINMDRIGRRGTRLIKGEPRKQIFGLFEQYLKDNIDDKGHEYSMDSIYNFLFKFVDIQERNKVDFLIVDEFQDLSLNMMQALRKCVKNKGSVLLLGDKEQNIFGTRITWKETGFIGRNVLYLDHVYRNTDEICELAKKILEDPRYLRDDENNENVLAPFQTGIKGEKPKLLNFNSESEMITQIHKYLENFRGSSAIIYCDQKYDHYLKKVLRKLDDEIDIGNVEDIKGMEYDNVIIPYYDRFNIDINSNGEKTKDEIISEHLKKLYVAVTRARRNLVLMSTKENAEYEQI